MECTLGSQCNFLHLSIGKADNRCTPKIFLFIFLYEEDNKMVTIKNLYTVEK